LQFQPVDGFDGFFPVLCFCALKERFEKMFFT